ncbi:MAG: hypothetical protein WKG07_09565 [Hymenobacter sp.]
MLALLEFEITVLDDRARPAHPGRQPLCPPPAAVLSYETLAAADPSGPHRYVVVMTVGYRTDAVALRRPAGHALPLPGRDGQRRQSGRAAPRAGCRRLPADGVARLRGPVGCR